MAYCPLRLHRLSRFCPLTLRLLTQALDELKGEGEAPIPEAIFISIDPERDVPSKITAFLAPIHQDLIGLTGTHTELKKLIQSV